MSTTFEDISPTLHKHMVDNPVKGHLYHYTGAAGLIGILEHKKLWMSNAEHLNDAQEIKHFNNVFREVNEWAEEIDVPYNYFIGSFSEESDLLSQWRAYCPEVGGFSLGIPANHLQQLVITANEKQSPIPKGRTGKTAERMRNKYNTVMPFYKLEHEFLLIKCIYDLELQRKIAKEVAGQRGEDIIKLCPIFKHPSFEEEKEWRIISPINGGGSKFRDSPRGLTMYCEFDLSPEELSLKEAKTEDNTFMEIICGPTTNKLGIKQAATRLLSASGFFTNIGTKRHVKESKIPYKTW